MTDLREFKGFGKIARLSRECVITEKIDGTNAQVVIKYLFPSDALPVHATTRFENMVIYVGSRNRWINPNDDNYVFAKWVYDNADCIVQLGEGRHFGEWYGKGIQHGYGMSDRRFALFNVGKWNTENTPECCTVVPTLYSGVFDTNAVDAAMNTLAVNGSVLVPGWMRPEGVMVYHIAANTYFKKTFNDNHKG